jgi:hypothetical protein
MTSTVGAGCVGGGRIFRASASMHAQQMVGVLSASKVPNELYSFECKLTRLEDLSCQITPHYDYIFISLENRGPPGRHSCNAATDRGAPSESQ